MVIALFHSQFFGILGVMKYIILRDMAPLRGRYHNEKNCQYRADCVPNKLWHHPMSSLPFLIPTNHFRPPLKESGEWDRKRLHSVYFTNLIQFHYQPEIYLPFHCTSQEKTHWEPCCLERVDHTKAVRTNITRGTLLTAFSMTWSKM